MLILKGPYKPIETGAMKADYDVHPRSHIGLDYLGLENNTEVYWNLTPAELYEHAILHGEAILTKDHALLVHTGKFTGALRKISLWLNNLKLWMKLIGVPSTNLPQKTYSTISSKKYRNTYPINAFLLRTYFVAQMKTIA